MAFEEIMRDNAKKTDYVRTLVQHGMLSESAAVDQLMDMGAETVEKIGREYFMQNPEEADRLFVAPAWMKGFYDADNRPMCLDNPFSAYIELLSFKEQECVLNIGEDVQLVNEQGCTAYLHIMKSVPYNAKFGRHADAMAYYRVNGTVDRYTGATPQEMYLIRDAKNCTILVEATAFARDIIRQNFSAYYSFINRTYNEVRNYYKALLK